MKLVSFRIKNYKSVKDSGECYLQDTVTIFAGKNGSGKSNVLEALYKFTTQDFDFEEDNYNYEDECPIIQNKYKWSIDELKEIKDKFNTEIGEEVIIELDTNDNKEYLYEIELQIDLAPIENNNKKIIEKIIKETANDQLIIANSIEEVLENYEGDALDTAKEVVDNSGFIDTKCLEENIEEFIMEHMPQFVYQKTIENELKSIITKESIKTNDFHKDISKLLNFNANDFDATGDKSKRTRRSNKLSQTLTGNFGAFYTQDEIELKFALDGDSIKC